MGCIRVVEVRARITVVRVHCVRICAPQLLFFSTYRDLLELWWDAESGLPCDTLALNVPCDASVENAIEVTSFNRSRFLYLPVPSLVFDTTNRVFYEFPSFSLALVCRYLLRGVCHV